MQSPLTPPTDSLYKFVAIFCLSLILASMLGVVHLNTSHNRFVYEGLGKMLEFNIASEDKDSVNAFSQTVLKLLRTSKKNADFLSWCLVAVNTCAFIGAWRAFHLWFKREQKIRDQLLELELAKSKEKCPVEGRIS